MITWKPDPSPALKAEEAAWKFIDFRYSLGLTLDPVGAVVDVVPGSAADRAGLAPTMKLVAVGGRAYEERRLRESVTSKPKSLELILTLGDSYKVVSIDASSGSRYPWLERIPGADDHLTKILAPRTK